MSGGKRVYVRRAGAGASALDGIRRGSASEPEMVAGSVGSGRGSLGVRSRRLACAVAIVAFVVAFPVVLDAAMNVWGHEGSGRQAQTPAAFPRLDAGDPLGSLDALEEKLDAVGGEVGSAFMEEVGLLPGASDVRVSNGGAVVGYSVEGDASDAIARIDTDLSEKGWTGVSLGELEGETFVKKEGVYRWMLVTATQVGESTSVVERLAAL